MGPKSVLNQLFNAFRALGSVRNGFAIYFSCRLSPPKLRTASKSSQNQSFPLNHSGMIKEKHRVREDFFRFYPRLFTLMFRLLAPISRCLTTWNGFAVPESPRIQSSILKFKRNITVYAFFLCQTCLSFRNQSYTIRVPMGIFRDH